MNHDSKASAPGGRQRGLSDSGATEGTSSKLPDWIGTDDDPAWLRLRDVVAQLAPIENVHRQAHACQVAVSHLAACGVAPDPIAEATLRALNDLALDIHHECRRIRAGSSSGIATRRSRPSLWQWLRSPVDYGEPCGGNIVELRRRLYWAVAIRLLGGVGASIALVLNAPWIALAVLVCCVMGAGYWRYRTSAEAAFTFRARYFACLLSHLGDVATLLAMSAWLHGFQNKVSYMLPLAAAFFVLAGVVVRTGAHQFAVYVPRIHLEGFVRVAAVVVSLALVTAGVDVAVLLVPVTAFAYLCFEAWQTFGKVVKAGATEFAWTTVSDGGFTSSVFSAPHPKRSPSEAGRAMLAAKEFLGVGTRCRTVESRSDDVS
jgi:hypothetical protein